MQSNVRNANLKCEPREAPQLRARVGRAELAHAAHEAARQAVRLRKLVVLPGGAPPRPFRAPGSRSPQGTREGGSSQASVESDGKEGTHVPLNTSDGCIFCSESHELLSECRRMSRILMRMMLS